MCDNLIINKDPSIKRVVEHIFAYFGNDFFERYIADKKEKILDFWEDDLCAIGLKNLNKVVYISSWENRTNSIDKMLYYVEFEKIDNRTLETELLVKKFTEIDLNDLIVEMNKFLILEDNLEK